MAKHSPCGCWAFLCFSKTKPAADFAGTKPQVPRLALGHVGGASLVQVFPCTHPPSSSLPPPPVGDMRVSCNNHDKGRSSSRRSMSYQIQTVTGTVITSPVLRSNNKNSLSVLLTTLTPRLLVVGRAIPPFKVYTCTFKQIFSPYLVEKYSIGIPNRRFRFQIDGSPDINFPY